MERDAVLELYDRHADMVNRVALSMLRSPQEAEDVVQTVFLRLLERDVEVFPGKERALLARMAVNCCKNELGSARRTRTVPLEDQELPVQPEDREVLRAVLDLSEKYRTVVMLHCIEGYTFAEIAEILGIGPSAVSMRLHRARKLLAKDLGRNEP